MIDALVLEIADRSLRGARPRAAPPPYYDLSKTMKLAAGRRAGRLYDPDSDACQRFLLKRMDLGLFPRLAVCGPPQVGGKTQSTILPAMLRTIIHSRQLVGYGLPTLEALDKAWAEKIDATIRGSGYGDHLPLRGPGSRGGRPEVIYFHDPVTGEREGGIVFMTGGAYGSTVMVVLVDDVDKFAIGGQPDRGAVEDIMHRADSYGPQALRIAAGTIEWDIGSLILAIIEDSTDTRPWPQCPACNRHQLLVWENVVADYSTDTTAYDSARYRCEHCAVLWSEEDRQRAIEWLRVLFCDRGQTVVDGQVVGPASQSRTGGLTWGALDCSLADMRELCVEYRSARLALERGDHSLMRKFHRYRLIRPYTADRDHLEAGSELTWQALLDKSAISKWGPTLHTSDKTGENSGHTYSRHIADPPPEAVGCVVGEDIQADRSYWVLAAVAADGTTYDTAWGYQMARQDHRPWNRGECHAMLDQVDLEAHRACGALPFLGGFVDANDFTDDIVTWTQGHAGVWYPIKGEKAHRYDGEHDLPGVVRFADDGFVRLNSGNLRDMIHAAYRRPAGSTGSINLPHGLSNNASDRTYLQHLCAEMKILDPKTRKERIRQGPGRWDWQDARKYAHALALLFLRDLRANATETRNDPSPRRPAPGLTTPDGRPFLLSQR